MYETQLAALDRANRLRTRRIANSELIDLASNDYLGFAHNRLLFDLTCKRMETLERHAPKSSQLVNGYHEIHRDFERFMAKINGYEAAIVVGSGFLGNIALFEALPRKGDLLLIDEAYHASGIMAAKLTQGRAEFFAHNDAAALARKLDTKAKRVFVAVEGVYSMSGELVAKEVLQTAKNAGATLIIDEAHSAGVIGRQLHGILDHYDLSAADTIRLGTLGKAFGSYGAYILAAREVVEFLVNRAKPIIYSTAPSLFDIALAHTVAQHILTRRVQITRRIKQVQAIAQKCGYDTPSLILPITMKSDAEALRVQRALQRKGFAVGAIRRPTVKTPQLRVILRESPKTLLAFFGVLRGVLL